MSARKKTGRDTGKRVAPYVSERIRELAPEYGWDPRDVEDLIAKVMCGPEEPAPAPKKRRP